MYFVTSTSAFPRFLPQICYLYQRHNHKQVACVLVSLTGSHTMPKQSTLLLTPLGVTGTK